MLFADHRRFCLNNLARVLKIFPGQDKNRFDMRACTDHFHFMIIRHKRENFYFSVQAEKIILDGDSFTKNIF